MGNGLMIRAGIENQNTNDLKSRFLANYDVVRVAGFVFVLL